MQARKLPIYALAIGALAVAGCGSDEGDDNGGDGGGGGAAAPSTSAQTVNLSEVDFKIKPANPKVDAGEVTFQVTNDGKTDHALEVEGPGEEQETSTIPPGDSASLTVDLSKSGTYEMYCPIGNHKEMGMTGEITVGSGAGATDDSGGEKSEDDSGSDDSGDDDSGGAGSGY